MDFFPFESLIEEGVGAVMSAHLFIPALDPHLPTSLSPKVMTDLLQKEMGFKGLIISDALNMKALRSHYPVAQIATLAFLAGTDLLLYGDHIAPNVDEILRSDLPKAFHALEDAYHQGIITEQDIDKRLSKISKINKETSFDLEFLHRKEAYDLKRDLYRAAITLHHSQILPLKPGTQISFYEFGDLPFFSREIHKHFNITQDSSIAIVAVSKITDDVKSTLQELENNNIQIILVTFTSPYELTKLPKTSDLIIAYEPEDEAQIAAAEVILGTLEAKGTLPVKI